MPPKYPRKDTKTLEPDYNMNQLSLNIPTAYEPELNHPARYINRLVESLALRRPNIMGRPREYDPRMLLKLVLLAYSYGVSFPLGKLNALLVKTLLRCG